MAKQKKRMAVESCCAPAMDRARERQYQVEDGARILQKAGEIAGDKKLMKEIKSFANKQIADINKIAK